jgi:HEAT repeat protein
VAWLKDRATDEKMDVDVKSKISNAAVRAIALHRDPSAVATLIEFARSTPKSTTATSLRREAMTGLGQSRDPRAIQFLESIITK